jgi:hypothetical protein
MWLAHLLTSFSSQRIRYLFSKNRVTSMFIPKVPFLMEKVRNGTFTIYRKRVKMWHRDLRDLEATDYNCFISLQNLLPFHICTPQYTVQNRKLPPSLSFAATSPCDFDNKYILSISPPGYQRVTSQKKGILVTFCISI